MTTNATTIRIGIAGLGRLGKLHALTLARRTSGAQVVAACSPVADERAWAQANLGLPEAALHADLATMLASPEVDAVVLVTPTSLHADQTIAALEAGKHVFIEKPLALAVADCERVLAVAERHPQQVAMVGFVRRFDPSYASARAEVAAGRVGRPYLLRSQTCDKVDPSGFFVKFAPTSGGIFMDCSVHDIDLARWLLADAQGTAPKALRAFASGTIAVHDDLAPIGDVDNGLAIVEFDGGARAVFYASRTQPHGHETSTELTGTLATLRVGIGAHRDRLQISDAAGVRHRALDDFHQRFAEAFDHEMQAFVDACRGDAKALAQGASLRDATEATRIGVAITRSLKSGLPEAV